MEHNAKQKRAFDRLANALDSYLKAWGWQALVVGDAQIRQPLDFAQHNYEFVLRFTGGKKREKKRK